MLRLLRLKVREEPGGEARQAPGRIAVGAGSIFTTSAPRSANTSPALGPMTV